MIYTSFQDRIGGYSKLKRRIAQSIIKKNILIQWGRDGRHKYDISNPTYKQHTIHQWRERRKNKVLFL